MTDMKKSKYKPPRFAQWMLYQLIDEYDRDYLLGDFNEFYTEIREASGLLKADFWYWAQALKSLPHFGRNLIYWRYAMLKNYIKTAVRNILKQRTFSIINIAGLAMGLAVFTLFAVVAGFDLQADKFHENADNIYSMVQVTSSSNEGEKHSAFVPAPILTALSNEYSEIKNAAGAFPAGRMIVKYNDNIFYENKILYAGPDFLSIFSFPLTAGHPEKALAGPNSIVLSEKMAAKYFGNNDPLGEILMLDNKIPVTVSGIMKNIDEDYSSLQYDFLLSLETAENFENRLDDWHGTQLAVFLLLDKTADPEQLQNKFPVFVKKHLEKKGNAEQRLYLLPLLDFRMHSKHINSFWVRTDSFLAIILLSTASLVLIIACINFVNLSTSRYMGRMKEVGLRKVVGAQRGQLMKQFLSESVIMALLAFPLALLFYNMLMTSILEFIVHLDGGYNIWDHPFIFTYLPVLTLITGIFSGVYPAFVLSSFHPAKILKGNLRSGKQGSKLRRILVVSQFALAVFLIVLTMAWQKQYDHLFKVDFGYDRKDIAVLQITSEAGKNLDLLKESIKRQTGVESVSAAASLPGRWERQLPVVPQGMSTDDAWIMRVYDVDYEFLETAGVDIQQGRGHSKDYDDENNYVINEMLAKSLQWDTPIGRQLTVEGARGTVIGVTKDFNFRGATSFIMPTVLRLGKDNFEYLLIKYSSNSEYPQIAGMLQEQWNSIVPNVPFECTTLDDHFYSVHRGDSIFIKIFSMVDFIAIVISCLGLFGMVSYTVEKRTKEIGIRKTLGASVPRITGLLIKDFLILVVIANIIALPLGYYTMDSLLQYRLVYGKIDIGMNILLLTSAISFAAAIIAVISQTVKAAAANPIIALKYE